MTDIITKLKEKIDTKDILINEPMSKHTSFKTGGNADIFIKAHSIQEIQYILHVAREEKVNIFIFGNGSNLLVKDKGIRGITVKIELKNINIERKKDYAIVTIGAGNKIAEVAKKMENEELTGFEFAAGIPGTIGGFIRMNAGAYGKEAKDIVIETLAMDYDGNIKCFNNEEQKFEYRKSIFCTEKYVILETKIRLNYGLKEEIQKKHKELLEQRKAKQPLEYPSAGSTFKRGDGFITAMLIDECGLKGMNIGGAQVSTKHAGFVINKGNATSEDILKLIEHIKKVVYETKGKNIEIEIEIVGED